MSMETSGNTDRVPLRERNIVQGIIFKKVFPNRPENLTHNNWADLQAQWYGKYGEAMTRLVDENQQVRALITSGKCEEAAKMILDILGIEVLPEEEDTIKEAA